MCDPCYDQCNPCVPYNPCFDPCMYPPINPYLSCNPCCEPVYKPRCDIQEHALYPVKAYVPATVQPAQSMMSMFCNTNSRCCPTDRPWETLVSTGLCCDTSIAHISPRWNSSEASMVSGVLNATGLNIVLAPNATVGCPCGVDVSIVVTGKSTNLADSSIIFEQTTRRYYPAAPFCLGQNCPTTIPFVFAGDFTNTTSAPSSVNVYYNFANTGLNDSAFVDIKIKYAV